jgi:hypothetical protein
MKLPKNFPKHQTVHWWIKELSEFNPNAVLVFSDGPTTPLMSCLSIYETDGDRGPKDTRVVCVDIGE